MQCFVLDLLPSPDVVWWLRGLSQRFCAAMGKYYRAQTAVSMMTENKKTGVAGWMAGISG